VRSDEIGAAGWIHGEEILGGSEKDRGTVFGYSNVPRTWGSVVCEDPPKGVIIASHLSRHGLHNRGAAEARSPD